MLREIIPDEANGHELRTGNEDDTTWIWCRKCGAHTSRNIRALANECTGYKNIAQKRRLEQGCNPYTAKWVAIAPTDMKWCDVSAVAVLRACQALVEDDPRQREAEVSARYRYACAEAEVHDSDHCSEHDPLFAWDFRY